MTKLSKITIFLCSLVFLAKQIKKHRKSKTNLKQVIQQWQRDRGREGERESFWVGPSSRGSNRICPGLTTIGTMSPSPSFFSLGFLCTILVSFCPSCDCFQYSCNFEIASCQWSWFSAGWKRWVVFFITHKSFWLANNLFLLNFISSLLLI